jgi:hypothetical protein
MRYIILKYEVYYVQLAMLASPVHILRYGPELRAEMLYKLSPFVRNPVPFYIITRLMITRDNIYVYTYSVILLLIKTNMLILN